MIKSLRARLQIWYGLVLVAAVAGFAIILFVRARSAKFEQIDAQLISAVEYLDASLRGMPLLFDPRMDGIGPDDRRWPPMPPGKAKDKGGPPPMRRPPEQMMADLTLPRTMNPPADDPERPYFGIWRPDGRIIKAEGWPDNDASPGPPVETFAQPQVQSRFQFREAIMLGPGRTRILVGMPVRRELNELRAFGWQLAAIGIGVVALGLFGGWTLSKRVIKPIETMSKTAESISETNLSQRIDTEHVDTELAGLAHVLNEAFDRLQAAFARQSQFTADASHELRTPLAVVRSQADWALNKPRSAEEYREALAACRQSAERMTSLVSGLLTLARSDTSQSEAIKQPCDLAVIADESLRMLKPLAAEKGLKISADLQAAPVVGNPIELAQLIDNLLSNAVTYNRPGGSIRVRAGTNHESTFVEVSDTGIGISPDDLPFVFDRFYRVDKARSRAAGGAGLGLAICKSIVTAHCGSLYCDSQPGSGSTFVARLPLASENGEKSI